jgi:hypothetical protein
LSEASENTQSLTSHVELEGLFDPRGRTRDREEVNGVFRSEESTKSSLELTQGQVVSTELEWV